MSETPQICVNYIQHHCISKDDTCPYEKKKQPLCDSYERVWNYNTIVNFFKENQNYQGKPYYHMEEFTKSSYIIRLTRNVLILLFEKYMEVYTPVKNSYSIESLISLNYDDIKNIRLNHVPFLDVTIKLNLIKSVINLCAPLKSTIGWGKDVNALPIYCEERLKEFMEKSQ